MTPQFCSIEEQLGRYRQEYYEVLGEVGQGAWHPERDATRWVEFCLSIHHRQATTLLKRTRELAKLWEMLEQEIESFHLPERAIPALADAALGFRVRNTSYRVQAGITATSASKDIGKLIAAGLLEVGGGYTKSRFYVASEKLRRIREASKEHAVTVPEVTLHPSTGPEQLPLFWEDAG